MRKTFLIIIIIIQVVFIKYYFSIVSKENNAFLNEIDVTRIKNGKAILLEAFKESMLKVPRNDIATQKMKQKTSLDEIQQNLLNTWHVIRSQGTAIKKETASYLIREQRKVQQDDITLVTQLSMSKLNNFLIEIEWWQGPVAAAVFLEKENEIPVFADLLKRNTWMLKNTALLVVMEASWKKDYPVNLLRNLAMELVDTDYFLALDVDFIPSKNCYRGLRDLLRRNSYVRNQLRYNKTMFVLPAFDFLGSFNTTSAVTDMLPRSSHQLMEMIHNGQVEPFHSKSYPVGHGSTDFEKWKSLQENRSTFVIDSDHGSMSLDDNGGGIRPTSRGDDSYPITFVDGFEPYVLGYRHGIPDFWPSFRGFPFNKCAWFMELDAAGYHFETLVDFYVVHLHHGILHKYDKYISILGSLNDLNLFYKYVKEKYNRTYHLWIPTEKDLNRARVAYEKDLRKFFQKGTSLWHRGDLCENNSGRDQAPDSRWSLLRNIWTQLEDSTEAHTECNLSHFICRGKKVQVHDVVLLSHLGVSKLPVLVNQIKFWGGPSSISIYIRSEKDIETFRIFLENNPTLLQDASFHVVLEKTNKPYPHNVLRNLAMENAETDFFVALDVDFIPSQNSHNGLFNLIHSNLDVKNQLQHNKTLFVLPAFDRWADNGQDYATVSLVPRSFQQVLDMVGDGRMNGFDMDHFTAGHGPTNFSKWISLHKADVNIEYYSIKYEERFEPYVLGYRPGIPSYWKNFRGYGYNKYSWFMELNAAGYRFATLVNFFVVHLEHPEKDKLTRSEDMQENHQHVVAFSEYLEKKYNRSYTFYVPSQAAIERERMRRKKARETKKKKRIQVDKPRLFEAKKAIKGIKVI